MKSIYLKSLIALLFIASVPEASAQIITTIAGTDSAGYNGDGMAATSAWLNHPLSVATDKYDNVYIADLSNNKVRKVDAGGHISTFAGTGVYGYSGDGGPATAATFKRINDVCTDTTGNVYLVDEGNYCLRKVDRNGLITTIAGNGTGGYSVDGGMATDAQFGGLVAIAINKNNTIYLVDEGDGTVHMIDKTGKLRRVAGYGIPIFSGDGGPATDAGLRHPSGIATDSKGNVLISDGWASRIRKVDTNGIITTYAGNGTSGGSGDGGPATNAAISSPCGLAVDKYDRLYIACGGDPRIRMVDTNGYITTKAGSTSGFSGDGGPATAAQLSAALNVWIDRRGDMFMVDPLNNRVRKVNSGTVDVPDPALNNRQKGTIYPCPNTGTFTISLPSAITEDTHLIITTTTGNVLAEYKTKTNEPFTVHLSAPAGVYLAHWKTPTSVTIDKLIIE